MSYRDDFAGLVKAHGDALEIKRRLALSSVAVSLASGMVKPGDTVDDAVAMYLKIYKKLRSEPSAL